MTSNSEGVSENASKLLELARKKFGKLKEAEEELFRCFADGEFADYSADKEKDNNPAKADKWGDERVIRAECIFWLCINPESSAMVTHKGIRVKGARIDGGLDLSNARIPFPLWFEKSAYPVGINLRHAEIRNLNLEGTYTGPIYGDGLKVGGYVFLRNGFKSEGEVNLIAAIISGDFDCRAGKFINEGATTINAGGANIEGNVCLCDGFESKGQVNLVGATIGRNLDCKNGRFINGGAKALNINQSHIAGGVYLVKGFKAEGEVDLLGATIGQSLECDNGQFINKVGYALKSDSMKVKRHVFLREGFKAEGLVVLTGATIDGYFVWVNVNSPEGVTLDLRSATVGGLWDDKDSWPDEDNLFLNNFEYKEIDEDAPRDAEERIVWLRRQPEFHPQPYEQLAAVLRKGGQDEDAKKVLIAKNEEKAGLTTLTRSEKIWYRVLGPMIGYGYRPLNALRGILFFVVLGWILFWLGYRGGLITPQSESAYVERNTVIVVPGDDDRYLSDVYPRFNFLIYSVDTFVPLIDLHQSKYWLPNANRGPGLLNIKAGGLLRLYLWIHITMGWALTTLLVVGLTGLVRT